MPPQLAFLLTVIFVLWLFVRDIKRRHNLSKRLWVPLAWILIMGSRPVSTWFSGGTDSMDEAANSTINRVIFVVLIVSGFFALIRAQANRANIISNSKWFFIYFSFVGLSLLWAQFPFTVISQWLKDACNVVMVLIILSEENPGEAVNATLARAGYVLVPFSFLVAKYYPDIGRSYNRWTYEPIIVGVTQDKNYLGAMLLVCGAAFLWGFLDLRSRPSGFSKYDLFDHCALLMMTFWLLIQSNCATSLACTIIVACVLFTMKWSWVRNWLPRLTTAHLLTASLCIICLHLVFGVGELLAGILGRDLTFTGRTEIWERCLSAGSNPLLGTGYCNFWMSAAADKVSDGFYYKLREAHNGYIEAYLNLGLMGLGLLVLALCAGATKIQRELKSGSSYAAFRLAFFIVVLIYNITESAFNGINMIWFTMLLVLLDCRDTQETEMSDVMHEGMSEAYLQADLEEVNVSGRVATA